MIGMAIESKVELTASAQLRRASHVLLGGREGGGVGSGLALFVPEKL